MVTMPDKKPARSWSLVTRSSPLPGFRLSLGFTLTYLTIIVLIPLVAIVLHGARLGLGAFLHTVTAPRVLASYRVTLGSAAAAALLSSLFGLLLAWVLARYDFPGKRIVDALVDLPFALPTAVAGISRLGGEESGARMGLVLAGSLSRTRVWLMWTGVVASFAVVTLLACGLGSGVSCWTRTSRSPTSRAWPAGASRWAACISTGSN